MIYKSTMAIIFLEFLVRSNKSYYTFMLYFGSRGGAFWKCTDFNNKVSPCTHRASYPDMGGSWVKQVELDEAMQVTTIISL